MLLLNKNHFIIFPKFDLISKHLPVTMQYRQYNEDQYESQIYHVFL